MVHKGIRSSGGMLLTEEKRREEKRREEKRREEKRREGLGEETNRSFSFSQT
jgi:hypothetical protein